MSTAIAIVRNDEGFGLACDSLHCAEGSDDVLNPDVQKIFETPNTKLAYALCGTTQLIGIAGPDISHILFDFADQVPQALERLTQANEPTLWHFADRLGVASSKDSQER
jgi:hypothetical protein